MAEKKDKRICKCECGGTVRGVYDFGRLFSYCDRCSPVITVRMRPVEQIGGKK